jgi:hypothetical protein
MSETDAAQSDTDSPQKAHGEEFAATGQAVLAPPNPRAAAALAKAQAYARQSAAPATLRAYKADWAHYAAWCAEAGFDPVPAAPATVGAYLASLATSHAPTTIRRRLSAIA